MVRGCRHSGSFGGWVVVLCILIFFSARSECYSNDTGKTLVWITVDTESISDWSIVQQLDAKADGVEFGIKGIMDLCDRFGVKATFFLNAYEYTVYGEETISKIAQFIRSRGHDVQLHPHPDWAYDKRRPALWQYTLDEQIEIVRRGKELLMKWIGSTPIASRAGGYMANNDTLKALARNGFLLDSSYYYRNPECRIQIQEPVVNAVREMQGIWEVPVTLYVRSERPNRNVLGLSPVLRYRKIDVDWADMEDLRSAMEQAADHHLRAVVFFLHSFSFGTSVKGSRKDWRPAVGDLEKFADILSFVSADKRFRVADSPEIARMLVSYDQKTAGSDFVPRVDRTISYSKYFKRRYKE